MGMIDLHDRHRIPVIGGMCQTNLRVTYRAVYLAPHNDAGGQGRASPGAELKAH